MAGCRDLDEEEPSEINTKNHPHFVDVKKDKLTAVYVGKGNHTDFGSVQSNVPVPVNRSVYYFEVIILEPGTRGTITIGLTDRSFLLNRQPGGEANSYGYRAEDGKKFLGSNRGEPYGPAFGKNDIVGCGIDFIKGLVFFTRNGVNLGAAGQLGLALEYFPTLAMHSPNEKAQFRFSPPFAFNPAEVAEQNLREERASIFEEKIPRDVMMKLVRSYIVSNGYAKTLRTFDASSQLPKELPQDGKTKLLEESAEWRQEVRRAILDGQILTAIETIHKHCPMLFSGDRPRGTASSPSRAECSPRAASTSSREPMHNSSPDHTGGTQDRCCPEQGSAPRSPRRSSQESIGWGSFRTKAVAMLYSQHFIELLRDNCKGEALKWLREKMSPLRQDASTEVASILRDSCVLIAYAGATRSSGSNDKVNGFKTPDDKSADDDMLHPSRRALCAELANAACVKIMLGTDDRNSQDAWSPLQFALRHTVILRQAMHARNVDRGPVVCPRLLCCG